MRLYKFEYVANKDGFRYLWIPAHSPACAIHKAQGKNVVKDQDDTPVIVEVDSKPLNKDWK